MTPNEPVKELKPCPFCGKDKVRRNGNNYQIWCINDDCKGNLFVDADTWQNAYCWQQSTRSERLIAELVKALEYYQKPVFCGACLLPIERGDVAREALLKAEKFLEEK